MSMGRNRKPIGPRITLSDLEKILTPEEISKVIDQVWRGPCRLCGLNAAADIHTPSGRGGSTYHTFEQRTGDETV